VSGFFLISIQPNNDRSLEFKAMKQAFAEIGFSAPDIVQTSDYVFAAYPDIENKSLALERYGSGDFVFICGTCIREVGIDVTAGSALCNIKEKPAPETLMGHYAIVMKRGGNTEITLDQFGGYHVFYNLANAIVSTSFYAICSALNRLTLLKQSAFEYVFNGVVSGNDTLFDEVSLAPIGATIRVGPAGLDVSRPKLRVTRKYTPLSRSESLEQSMTLLDRYFHVIAQVFGDSVCCALSGGYDSRLMLACMRRHGIRPRVFVYGHAAEADVSLAIEIARCEGFPLAVIDKNHQPPISPEEFAITVHRNFLAQDVCGWAGIFQNNAEIFESAHRVQGNKIAFNGGGGEIFRNFFYLLDRQFLVRELLWSFYSRFDPLICMEVFDREGYYQALERKIADLLGTDEPLLARPTVEWLYHSFRCRAWDGAVDSLCSRYGFTAMPYLERSITEHASALRLSWKNHGVYEAELIQRADHRLARYSSVYGHDFDSPPPLSRRFADYATYLRPPWLRRHTYRLRHLSRRADDWPGYLAQPYRNAALLGENLYMRRLFRFDRIVDAEQFARILSLEYVLRQFGGRIRLQF
jgi:hypothetical protein